METKDFKETDSREKRYQWFINIMLMALIFLAGIFYESERLKVQVVANTVEIRLLKETLGDIQHKLNILLEARRL